MKDTIRALWNTFKQYRLHVVALAIFGIISALLEGIGINAVIPLMSFFFGSDAVPAHPITSAIQNIFEFFSIPFTFRFLLGFILLLFIVRATFIAGFGYIRGWISADFLGKESEDVLRRTLLSSWAFMLKQRIGAVHNTLVRDIQQTGTLLGAIAQIIQSFTGFFMYLVVALSISPSMTLYAIGGGAILIFFLRPFLRRARLIGEEAAGVEKQFAQFLNEHIAGMKAVKATGREESAIKSGNAHIRLLRSLSIQQTLVRSISGSTFQPFSLVLVVILFFITYRTPSFSIIAFAASLYLLQKIFTYLESGQNALHSVQELMPYARNIAAFKQKLDTNKEIYTGSAPFRFTNELAFRDVSFSYSESTRILHGFNLTLRKGETVGLVGPSGAGKTSVADLLLRLFTPDVGELLLDGVAAEAVALSSWRTKIGYVAQDIFLMNGTIEENIRFYNTEVTFTDIEEAAKQANIYDFVRALPKGFQTLVGDRGVLLSGGQRQRVALARALAGKPDILILDEATSALDHESEKLIHQSIRTLRGVITVLIIAHRPTTVAEADRIVVLHQGRIKEEGTPQALLRDADSYFSKMQHT